MLTWKLGVMYVSYTYLLVPIRKHILYIAVLDNIYIYYIYIYILFYIYNIYIYVRSNFQTRTVPSTRCPQTHGS